MGINMLGGCERRGCGQCWQVFRRKVVGRNMLAGCQREQREGCGHKYVGRL